jgi:adenylate cyclase
MRTRFESSLLIGRAPDVDVQVLDTRVSKRHALIQKNDEAHFILKDLDSRNGTLINNERIRGEVFLKNGDVIQVGDSLLTFEKTPSTDQMKVTPTGTITVGVELPRDEFPKAESVTSAIQLSEDYDRLRLAWRLSQVVGLDRALREQSEQVLRLVVDEFEADRGMILLLPTSSRDSTDPDDLRPIAAFANGDLCDPKDIQISTTIVGTALSERRGVLAADARQDTRFDQSKSIVLQGIRSTLCAPLISRSQTMHGILVLDSVRVVNAFHHKDLAVLETIGAQIASALDNIRLLQQMRRQVVVRERLSRLLSPNIVDEVVAGRVEITNEGETRDVTILFADLRDFTAQSQQMSPEEVVRSLNGFFSLCVDVLFKYEGTLDKFLGDGLMALFGAPVSQEDATDRALKAASGIQSALKAWNIQRAADGLPALEAGIGIATGPCVAGAIGTEQTLSYTVIGQAANLADRLCSSAKAYEIVLSDDVAKQLNIQEELGDPYQLDVKGFDEPVTVYNVKIRYSATQADTLREPAADDFLDEIVTTIPEPFMPPDFDKELPGPVPKPPSTESE